MPGWLHNRVMDEDVQAPQPDSTDPDSYYGEEDIDAGDLDLSFLDDEADDKAA